MVPDIGHEHLFPVPVWVIRQPLSAFWHQQAQRAMSTRLRAETLGLAACTQSPLVIFHRHVPVEISYSSIVLRRIGPLHEFVCCIAQKRLAFHA
jgi:hypothetical protein